ncbi:MAG TPA: aldehyde dehydrogenase family protein [Candidatus Saccharimonadales bacterium]|nr:aldehyde dehydrogenase family protein [Candidatus Saccharimonadales bacterium]
MKIASTNPSRNYEVIGEVEASTEQQVKEAVAKACAAQPKWAALSQAERNAAIESFVEVCNKHADEIAELMSKEMGKPITQARAQVKENPDFFKAQVEMAEKVLAPEIVYEDDTQRHHLTREPLGVIACITPWNFPFLNLPWQMGQALLAGNTVVFKQSEEVIVFSQLMGKLIAESDMPEGVWTAVFGDGAVGELLVQQPVDAIMFTGSTRTGQRITELAAKTSTRVLTEMGGSAPGIVFEDADVPAIIDTLYMMRFDNTGQYCDGLKRLLVHESKLDRVLEALKKVNTAKKVGDALDEKTDIGPLVAKRQVDLLKGQLQDALDKGAKVVFGGKEPAGLQGAYFEPTVLTNISFDMRIWKEEVFGPMLPVVTFKTEDEAVKLANDTIYGLGAFVFTTDKDRYFRVAKQIQSGIVAHNNALYFSTVTPFGGYKASGNSRSLGVEGFHEVTQVRVVSEEKAKGAEQEGLLA